MQHRCSGWRTMARLAVCAMVCVCFLGVTQRLAAAVEESPVIAEAKAWKLTMDDLQRIISSLRPEQQEVLRSDARKMLTFVRRLVQTRVLAEMARDKGFAQRPDVQEQVSRVVDDILAQLYVREEAMTKTEVTDEDVRLYYDIHKGEFMTPAQAHLRHILLRVPKTASDEQIKEIHDQAKALLDRIQAGEDFASIAQAHSEDATTKDKGGDLGWVFRNKLDPQFAKAAFGLKPGEVGGPIRSRFGIHLIKLEARKAGSQMPYAEVSSSIREKIQRDFEETRVKNFVDGALKSAGVQIHSDQLLDAMSQP